MVRILPLDGTNSIGGSKIFVEEDDFRIMLDFGTNYHEMNKYYEEYLKPRSNCGILDFLEMGVLPNVRNLYRNDLIHPDARLTGPELNRPDAVLITHAHMDHMGALGFLDCSVPVVTTLMTATIMKALQDAGTSELGSDGVYANLRESETCHENTILRAKTGKVPGRDFKIADCEPTKGFEDFWEFYPPTAVGERARKSLEPGKLLRDVPGVRCRACHVDHSIKGACGFIIDSASGSIVYTGDIRLHGICADKTREFVDKARSARPYALIIEGTTINRPADEQVSENDVRENAAQLMGAMSGELVIADFGPRNIERLEIFLALARENDRELVISCKDAYLLHAMHIADRSVPEPGKDLLIYNCPRSSYGKWEEWTLLTKYPDFLVKPSAIRDSPGSYVLAFSFWDMKNLIDIRPSKGHYLYSSSEAYSEDQEIDFKRLQNWLDRFGIEKYGFDFDREGRPVFPKGLHASGHASEHDLEEIIEGISPEILIPVHTEHPEWFARTFEGRFKTILPEKMKWIDL